MRIFGLILALAITGGVVRAEPEPAPDSPPDEVIVVTDTRPRAGVDALDGDDPRARDRERALREPAFVTVVHLDDRAGELATSAELLAETVGVNVRSLGGLGGFSAISVRGADPAHTAVFVDGVPLSRLTSPVIDLGVVDVSGFGAIEVYRGGVPVELGGAALGGAVRFVTEVGPGTAVSAGAGSFGSRSTGARWGDSALGGDLLWSIAAGYRGATGDYEYFNDNGTDLDPDDDAYVARTNNGFDQLTAAARARYRGRHLVLAGGARALWKSQGVPGVASVQTEAAHLGTFLQLADVSLQWRPDARWLITGTGYAAVQRERFDDRLGEVGLGTQDNRYATDVGGLGATARRAVGGRHAVVLGLDGRVDDFTSEQLVDGMAPSARRWAGAGSLAVELVGWGDRVVVVPAVRLDASATDPGTGWEPMVVGDDELERRRDWFASPRVAARARVADGVAVKGSAGRYLREPTVTELFGDRGAVFGDPSLRPETGENVDLGVVVAPAGAVGAVDRVYVEAAVFAARSRDTIAVQATAGNAARVGNLGDARSRGAELAATARLGHRLTLVANYTWFDSRQVNTQASFEDKQLPGRPRHQAYARADLALRPRGVLVVLWVDGQLVAGNARDRANFDRVPARRLVGAGIKLAPRRGLLIALEAKNLTDARVESIDLDPAPRPDLTRVDRAVADFLGYPLPGRALYLTLDWSF